MDFRLVSSTYSQRAISKALSNPSVTDTARAKNSTDQDAVEIEFSGKGSQVKGSSPAAGIGQYVRLIQALFDDKRDAAVGELVRDVSSVLNSIRDGKIRPAVEEPAAVEAKAAAEPQPTEEPVVEKAEDKKSDQSEKVTGRALAKNLEVERTTLAVA